jgi:hypothetical protein
LLLEMTFFKRRPECTDYTPGCQGQLSPCLRRQHGYLQLLFSTDESVGRRLTNRPFPQVDGARALFFLFLAKHLRIMAIDHEGRTTMSSKRPSREEALLLLKEYNKSNLCEYLMVTRWPFWVAVWLLNATNPSV